MAGLKKCFILLALAALAACSPGETREILRFNGEWKFTLINNDSASAPGYDDSSWRTLELPHDWSIEGEFSADNPATPGGGALPGGTGWYRKSFLTDPSWKGSIVYVDFDGVYRNSEVWINGHYLGKRPYGYSSFRYEISPYLNYGRERNVIAVKVDNSKQPNSRWYSGSGIYRNVWLVKTAPVAVNHWGTFITTPEVNNKKALLNIKTEILNNGITATDVTLVTSVYNPRGKKVARVVTGDITLTDSVTVVNQELNITDPVLWSDKNPALYMVETTIWQGNKKLDEYVTNTGIRKFEFDKDKGFILNGEVVKIRGVCNHHDLGCLGAAINTRALERQLEMLREMGCNAIRTSHNPPAPELLDLCDRMGFIVMDEAFDMWRRNKTPFDYGLDFDQWHTRDLTDMVRRDRNHPSVFIWSIGNEIIEQWDSTGIPLARELAGTVRSLDTTRPITSACNSPVPDNYIIKSGALDLIGYNYSHKQFAAFPQTFPGQKFIGSETTSALETRGSYDMPSDSIRRWPERWDVKFESGNPDLTCSSYDNCSTPWGTTHEESWKAIKAHDYLSGMFIWTGFDYLGEPTPYTWPARSSYFGIIDLAGFPKDSYYMYQSEWTDKPVLHLFPHWNWKQGEVIDVWAYTSCDEVELFLNGMSLGSKRKEGDNLHLMWRVTFEPGVIEAVGRNDGKEIMRKQIRTAGAAAGIRLTPDRSVINADGEDLSFVKVEVLDKDGNIVPFTDNLIKFSIEGNASIAGVDNGCQTSMEPFHADYRKAFHGLCLVVLKAGKTPGKVKLTASSDGLESAEIQIEIKR